MPDCIAKPFVHLAIDAVDTVIFDPEARFDPEQFDHYESFDAARDAALSSIEEMLDLADYDGEDHRQELERMYDLLETATSFDDLKRSAAYRGHVARLSPAHPAAA